VYILNALYLAPITLWTYLKYGRPEKLMKMAKDMDMGNEKKAEASEAPHHDMSGHEHMQMKMEGESHDMGGHDHTQMKMEGEHQHKSGEVDMNHGDHHHEINHGGGCSQVDHTQHANHDMAGMDNTHHDMAAAHKPKEAYIENHGSGNEKPSKPHDMSHMDHGAMNHAAMNHGAMNHGKMHNMHMPSADQPMFPTVTIAVCHCGAGCLLGDIVGEWLVFGTNATLGGRSIGPEFLIGIHPLLPLP
jgi:hypothetical protein